VIRVGGATEVEVRGAQGSRLMTRCMQPVRRFEEGIVPGGGVALLRASHHLKGLRTKNDDQKTGPSRIVRKGAVLSGPSDRDQCWRRRLGDRR